MVQGDLRLYDPGESVTVEVVADANGTVAERGDIVELVEEANATTRVRLASAAGTGVGHLTNDPDGYDPNTAYNAGDVIGTTTVLVDGPVDWFDPSDGYDPAVGDLVVSDTGGTVRAYDVDGTAPDDTPDMLFGRVFATGTRATAQTAQKAAILRRY